MWLPVTASDKIETGLTIVNAPPAAFLGGWMSLTLLAAIASLLGWIVLVFFAAISAGAVHLLLAVSATLLVRWWALRA